MKFRKKPVVIEAMQYDGSPTKAAEIVEWVGEDARYLPKEHALEISTLEGVMTVSGGDFVIQGIQGEFYPCKPDIFWDTYDAVEES